MALHGQKDEDKVDREARRYEQKHDSLVLLPPLTEKKPLVCQRAKV